MCKRTPAPHRVPRSCIQCGTGPPRILSSTSPNSVFAGRRRPRGGVGVRERTAAPPWGSPSERSGGEMGEGRAPERSGADVDPLGARCRATVGGTRRLGRPRLDTRRSAEFDGARGERLEVSLPRCSPGTAPPRTRDVRPSGGPPFGSSRAADLPARSPPGGRPGSACESRARRRARGIRRGARRARRRSTLARAGSPTSAYPPSVLGVPDAFARRPRPAKRVWPLTAKGVGSPTDRESSTAARTMMKS
jgi:hypothetical protein